MNPLLLIVVLAPLLAAFVTLALWRRAPRCGGWLAVIGTLASFAALLVLAQTNLRLSASWLMVGDFKLTIGLRLDGLSWFMALLVAGVSCLVNLYAVAYMKDEAGQPRFFALMSFFAGAMLALVLADSFALLFMAWEMVGLASFGLIGFHFEEEEARRAALKAFLLTRTGDFGLLLGWLIVLNQTHTTNLSALLDATAQGAISQTTLTLIALLFFAASVGKSAQLPLTAWLPDAMAGPTPVSALIHSATMVAAGVYLVLRVFPVFAAAPLALDVVLWVGAATALFAALIATAQYDLKRVLAWSTVSQLGEMMIALGLASPLAAAYHLAAHAAFKSTLFLTAGAVDHATGSRDLRKLGGLWRRLPLTAGVFAAAALALAGFPPFSGFWSEEKIVGRALETNTAWAWLMLALIFLAGVYISRAGFAVFAEWKGTPSPAAKKLQTLLLAPMILLGVAALGLGFALKTTIERVLPFAAHEGEVGLWRWGAIAASAAGLLFGAWRVRAAGAAPAFGAFPQRLAQGLQAATQMPAKLATFGARMIERLERILDAGARALFAAAMRLAGAAERVEQGLDRAAEATASATLQAANMTDVVEAEGFGKGIDRVATLFGRTGEGLRPLQSGKTYFNTMSLFAWVLLIGLLFVLIWR